MTPKIEWCNYADEIYNADSTVDKSEIEIIKAEDVL